MATATKTKKAIEPTPPPVEQEPELPWLAKFQVSAAGLAKHLTALSAVVKPNPTMPIFEGILFEYYGLDTLHLTACDGQTTLSQRLPIGNGGAQAWRAVVPLALLLPLLKALPDQPLSCLLAEPKNVFGVAVSRLHVQSANGVYKIALLDPQDWPAPTADSSEPTAIRLHVGELQAGLAGTVPIVSHDALRPAMTGVLVDALPEEVRLVATDGHRLNWWTLPSGIGGVQRLRYVLPGNSAKLLLGLLKVSEGDFTLYLTPSTARVELVTAPDAGWSWQCRLIDERFPDYEHVVPVSQPNRLLIQREELLAAVRRSNLYANKQTHAVELVLNEQQSGGELEVAARNLDFDRESREQLSAFYAGEPLKIGFDARFLLEELALVPGDELQLEFSTPNRACTLSGSGQAPGDPELRALLMPVMLNNYI